MDEYDDSSTSVKPSTHQIAYILECKNKIESGSKKLYFDPFDEPPDQRKRLLSKASICY